MKIIYIPLDDRACNYEFPYLLSTLTDSISLLRPPKEIIGFLKEPAKVAELWKWIFDNAADCEYAIFSVDTLIYGNLINSRIHTLSKEICRERLNNFSILKEKFPKLKIHAFNLIARVAAYDSSFEDPDYWDKYGHKIWRYTCLLDRKQRGELTKEEKYEMDSLGIPDIYLDDFLNRRETDRFVNLSCVELLSENIFELLTIPKDDTSEYGMAAMDSQVIFDRINELGVAERVIIHPGADEVGSVIFARVFCESKQYMPKVYVRYSATNGPFVIPKYEDRAVNESIKWQIYSVGGFLTDSYETSDCMLAVNVSGTKQVEASEQEEKIDPSFKASMNIPEFLRFIEFYITKFNKNVGLAEISCCNGCENNFMKSALKKGILKNVAAFGGWNTAQNTIGVVLAHTIILSFYKALPKPKRMTSEGLKLSFILSDWRCQADLTPKLIKEGSTVVNPYALKENYSVVRERYLTELQSWFNIILSQYYNSYQGEISCFEFDWDSIFFYKIMVELKETQNKVKGT